MFEIVVFLWKQNPAKLSSTGINDSTIRIYTGMSNFIFSYFAVCR